MASSSGPYKLVTVNDAPDRAKRIVGRVVEELKDVYAIEYVANAESMFNALPSLYFASSPCEPSIND